MVDLISINEHSKIPKYQQIINSILKAIEKGTIKTEDKLPSVNELLIEFDISRDTIVRAYDHLKRLKLIESVPGKGYYIKRDDLVLKAKVFLLFNKLSAHKKIIYDAFAKELGDNATIDFFIYDNNYRHFKDLILASKSREYTHYVIICHFEEGGDDLVHFLHQEIPLDRLVILDKKVDGFGDQVVCVYQDFGHDLYGALSELNPYLKKYKKVKLLMRNTTYHPIEIKNGFLNFCAEYGYGSQIVETIENEDIEENSVYINLLENDLVILIKKIKQTPYALGKEVGIISYNDTPLKEIVLDGITVISTDFENLGKKSAQLVLDMQKVQVANPFYVIQRKSL